MEFLQLKHRRKIKSKIKLKDNGKLHFLHFRSYNISHSIPFDEKGCGLHYQDHRSLNSSSNTRLCLFQLF